MSFYETAEEQQIGKAQCAMEQHHWHGPDKPGKPGTGFDVHCCRCTATKPWDASVVAQGLHNHAHDRPE